MPGFDKTGPTGQGRGSGRRRGRCVGGPEQGESPPSGRMRDACRGPRGRGRGKGPFVVGQWQDTSGTDTTLPSSREDISALRSRLSDAQTELATLRARIAELEDGLKASE